MTASGRPSRVLVMVWDGMRPDLISPELTPRLAALGASGVVFDDHHAVLPTVTRVNAANLATGAPTATHGLPANTFFAPLVDASAPLSIGEGNNVAQLRAVYGVFQATTISDVIRANGGRTAIVSSGTRGSAQMLHPRRAEVGDLILHPTLSSDEELRPAVELLGPLPPAEVPDTARNRWLARAIAEVVLPTYRPELLYFWHDDPDKSQHKFGFGHPLSLRAIREADEHLGIVLDGLDAAGLREETLVVVASDHGYVQIRDRLDLSPLRAALGDETGLVVAPNGCAVLLYLDRHDDRSVARVVVEARKVAGVEVIFSGVRGGAVADGTFALGEIGMDGPLAPDLLLTLVWSDDHGEHGHRGVGYELGGNQGNHGGGSSWEIHNTLIAHGPGVSSGGRVGSPTGVGDLAPTILTALGLPIPTSMTGRVLREALARSDTTHGTGDSGALPAAQRWTQTTDAGSLRWSSFGGRRYLDSARFR